jgi:hypothetical protein
MSSGTKSMLLEKISPNNSVENLGFGLSKYCYSMPKNDYTSVLMGKGAQN